MGRYKSLIALVLSLIALIVGIFYLAKGQSDPSKESIDGKTDPPHALLGQKLPEFTYRDGTGKELFSKDLAGKPVVIVDWASWCPDCQAYLPTVQKIYEKYEDKVTFVMLNLTDGTRETQEKAEAYIKEQSYTFPVYFDVGEVAADILQVAYIPTTYVVGTDNTIKQIFSSGIDEKELDAAIQSVLN